MIVCVSAALLTASRTWSSSAVADTRSISRVGGDMLISYTYQKITVYMKWFFEIRIVLLWFKTKHSGLHWRIFVLGWWSRSLGGKRQIWCCWSANFWRKFVIKRRGYEYNLGKRRVYLRDDVGASCLRNSTGSLGSNACAWCHEAQWPIHRRFFHHASICETVDKSIN